MRCLLFVFSLLCVLTLGGCAGGNTGIALGYGHHGPGIAVFTDNLWYTPHQAGVSVPLGWESGGYPHAPPAPEVSTAAPVLVGQGAGPVTGYVELPRAAPAPSRQSRYEAPGPAPAAAGRGTPGGPGSSSGPGGPDKSTPGLGETPTALVPPDLSYKP